MRRFVRSLWTFIDDRRGSMTVEFVAVAPLLVAAMLFGFEFGRVLWAYDVVTRDVQAAIRYLSRATTYDATAKAQATNMAKTGSPSGATAHFPWANCVNCIAYSETLFTDDDYSVDGFVITATATVPVSMTPVLSVLNNLTGGSVGANYTFVVTDRARWIGN